MAAGAEFHRNTDWLGGTLVHGNLDAVCAHVRMGKARIPMVSSGLQNFYVWMCISIPRHIFSSRAH